MLKHILAIALLIVIGVPSVAHDSALIVDAEYNRYIKNYLRIFDNLEVAEVLAVIKLESNFRVDLVTNEKSVHDRSYGPMQVRLKTARGMGFTGKPEALLTWKEGLYWGMKYLSISKELAVKSIRNSAKTDGQLTRRRMFAIYNAGGLYWVDGIVGGRYINNDYVKVCEINYWKFASYDKLYEV